MVNLDFCSVDEILMRRKSLRRELTAEEGLHAVRIAILGGSTTDQFVAVLELLLLSNGFRPTFYQSEYCRFYEEAVHDPQALIDFKPDLVYVHTSCMNVRNLPPVNCSEEQQLSVLSAELGRFREIWDSLETNLSCQIIQNNFELPLYATLGNMDASATGGRTRFFAELNVAFAKEISSRSRLLLQDVQGLSARVGLRHWFDWERYFSYKILLTPEANLELARSLCSLVRAVYGKSRKVLVLDLDNTLWGGVIGDDGADKIQIGRETAVAEAYTAFQEYCLSLRSRGILLAVCSKNNEDTGKAGFEHPDSVLKPEHISSFRVNWEPKHENILAIAKELNLGVDSFVFVDDNPAERAIVEAQIPGIAVPDVGSDVTRFAAILEAGRYFEPASVSKEDTERAALYADNWKRTEHAARFADYGEYLDSLEMTAEVDQFKPVYLDRIAQLTNKTNQFNLTTRRYTGAEIEAIAYDPQFIALYGKLSDKFGDNGLISVVIGRVEDARLHIDLWLMSCRVLKRDMELAMLDALVERARTRGIREIHGVYLPTSKNAMVSDHYAKLGFRPSKIQSSEIPPGASAWVMSLDEHSPRNSHIRVTEFMNAYDFSR